MGRKKVVIRHIPERYRRNATYKKRLLGAKKKLYELAALCGVELELSVRDESGKSLEYVKHGAFDSRQLPEKESTTEEELAPKADAPSSSAGCDVPQSQRQDGEQRQAVEGSEEDELYRLCGDIDIDVSLL